jgi:beta-lactamase regulating signal transducer with metallopeptidase domain
MTLIPDSASTTVLTYVANSSARALVLSGVAGLGLAAFRVKTTAVRLFTWTAVLYVALAMPLLQWVLPAVTVPTPAVLQLKAEPPVAVETQSPATGKVAGVQPQRPPSSINRRSAATHIETSIPVTTSVNTPSSSVRSAVASSVASSIRWSTVVAGIYLGMVFLFLARFIVGLAFGRRLLCASQPIDDRRVTLRLNRANASGLVSVPRAAESELISVPLTIGVLGATILLPSGWHEWDDAKLNAVMAHEMSHVARHDALTQRLSLLHRAIFWFSPLAWWLDRRLADLAEQASDEAALNCGADSKDYARTLLGFFEALQAAPGRVWWQGVSMAKAGQAEKRLERILGWKGSVAMRLKRSIAVVVLALSVPVVYLAASVHAANKSADASRASIVQSMVHSMAQDQAPSAPPDAHRAQAAPAPVAEPGADATPPPEPASQPEPAPAPIAIAGEVRGGVYNTPSPAVAPVARVAPMHGVAAYPPVAPIAPIAMAPPPVWPGQSARSRSSSGQGYSHAYGYDDDQRFVIVSGKSDSLTMSGSTEDARHVEKLRKTIPGDFIWFERDEKTYIIRDQATIDRARKLWAPQDDLGKKQEALGKQQEALGQQQEALGAKMEQIRVNVPDMTAELDKLKAEFKKLNSSATVEQIGELQSEIGDLQSKIGDIQSHAGDQQSKLGEEMGALGEKQGKLGEQQGELGRQQGELAREASKQMKNLLDEAIAKGLAQLEL